MLGRQSPSGPGRSEPGDDRGRPAPDLEDDALDRRIRAVVAGLTSLDRPPTAEADRPGPLSSIALVELIAGIERQLGVQIPARLLTTASFDSTDSILAVVRAAVVRSATDDPAEPGQVPGPPIRTGPATDRGRPDPVTAAGPGEVATVLESLCHWARVTPDARLLTWIPTTGTARTLTYAQLTDQVSRLARDIVAVGTPPPRIALLARNDIATAVGLLAIMWVGAAAVVLDARDPPARLRSILDAHDVPLILGRTEALDRFAAEAPPAVRRLDLDTVPDRDTDRDGSDTGPAQPADGPAHPVDPTGAALMFGTSGSTGAAKLVVQGHQALVANAEAVRRHHHLGPGDTVMGGLPLHHVNGVHFTVLAILHSGAHVVVPEHLHPLTYLDQVHAYQPRVASLVPTVLEMLLTTGKGRRLPTSLDYVVSAAAPLTRGLAHRTLDDLGVRVIQGYGLTETMNFSTTVPVDLSVEEYAEVMLNPAIPSVGVALPGNEVEVFGLDGSPAGPGEVGEVRMRGPSVMSGYADRPQETAVALADGWFHSGDLGYWLAGPRGRRYLYLTGRAKNVTQVGGEGVSLEEVERALVALPGVLDAGCGAAPHPVLGEMVVAAVVLRDGSTDELATRLGSLLPAAAIPRRWLVVDRLPRTVTGKLRRRELDAQLASGLRPGTAGSG